MDNLENVLESIIFVSGGAIDIADILSKIDVSKKDFTKAVENLKKKYSGDCGIYLREFHNKLQFSTNSAYAEQVALVLNPIREKQLSKAALETAAIIAYKQPITRLEIEEIRGVSSDYAINLLMEHNLVEVVGRKDAVGRPVLFGTTDEFLKRFNLNSITDLPSYESVLESIQIIREKKDDSLYNHFEVPTDKITPSLESEMQDTDMLVSKETQGTGDAVVVSQSVEEPIVEEQEKKVKKQNKMKLNKKEFAKESNLNEVTEEISDDEMVDDFSFDDDDFV